MTAPRQVLPKQFYLLTRRTTQRQFLMTPDEETNNAFVYCLAEAADRFQIEVILPQEMTNHHHTVLFDRYGRVIEFTAHFHKMFAKCMNALLGRSENFWSSVAPSIVRLVDVEQVMKELCYTATNPVLSHLVERVHHWPGPKTVRALLRQEPLVATRPHFFFREAGQMPETATLKLTIPPELGGVEEVLARLREMIALTETEKRIERAKEGRGLLGRRRVLRQPRTSSPSSLEPKRSFRPRFAAASRLIRRYLADQHRAFVEAYRAARVAWLANKPALFPPGTYWLARHAGVAVATA